MNNIKKREYIYDLHSYTPAHNWISPFICQDQAGNVFKYFFTIMKSDWIFDYVCETN